MRQSNRLNTTPPCPDDGEKREKGGRGEGGLGGRVTGGKKGEGESQPEKSGHKTSGE